MPRPLRYIPMEAKSWTDSRGQKIAVVEITIRAKQGRFLLCQTSIILAGRVASRSFITTLPQENRTGYGIANSPSRAGVGPTEFLKDRGSPPRSWSVLKGREPSDS